MINTNICLMMNEAISLIKAEYRSLADFSKNFSIVLEYNKKLFNQKQNILFVIKKDRIIKKLKIEEIINKKFKNFKFKFFYTESDNFSKKELIFFRKYLIPNQPIFFKNLKYMYSCKNEINKLLTKNNEAKINLFYLKSSNKKKYFLRNIKGKKYLDNILILQDAVYYDFDHFIKFLEKSSSQKLFDINSINIQYVNKNKYKMLEVNKFFSLEYENIFNLIEKNQHFNEKFKIDGFLLCNDHSGEKLKKDAIKIIKNLKIKFIDLGSNNLEFSNYNIYMEKYLKLLKSKKNFYGLSFCRTGQGMNIYANKSSKIISALVMDEYLAEFSIKHNCANNFCIPSKYVNSQMLKKIITSIIKTSFDGGRHYHRVKDLF